MKISKFRTDGDAELNGVWCDIGSGARLLIARAGNSRHKATLERLYAPYRTLVLANEKVPEEANDRVQCTAAASALLLGWEGLEGDDGQPIPYSVEKATELLLTLPDFRELVSTLALDRERFVAGERAAILGN